MQESKFSLLYNFSATKHSFKPQPNCLKTPISPYSNIVKNKYNIFIQETIKSRKTITLLFSETLFEILSRVSGSETDPIP